MVTDKHKLFVLFQSLFVLFTLVTTNNPVASGQSAATAGPDFRSAMAEENAFRIRAENDWAAAYLYIGYKENASDGYLEGEDVQKLFSPMDYVPEIYALASDIPVDILFINNKNDKTVPLGIKIGRTGEIRLTITGMDNYYKASKIEFIDASENKTINLTGMTNYIYTFNNTQTGITNGRFSIRFSAGESVSVWTPMSGGSDAQKRDWNNAANWTPSIVPTPVHSVYIPGNLSYYPQLTGTEKVKCRNIYFMEGGELGRPDLLVYNRAYVQVNFDLKQSDQARKDDKVLVTRNTVTTDRMQYSAAVSAPPLIREQWHMLSAPLRGIVTGDFAFGGFPLTFLMKFGPVNKDIERYEVGKWTTPYTKMTEPLNCTDGFAIYMYGYGMTDSNDGCEETGTYGASNTLNESLMPSSRNNLKYGLREINGILEFPFFEDATGMNAHRTQVYDPTSKQSTFYYVYDGQNGAVLNSLSGETENRRREDYDGNYRFIPEERSGGAWVFQNPVTHSGDGLGSEDEFMVGNPYMSSIDMLEFFKDNDNTKIQAHYRIWDGTEKTFISYQVDVANHKISPSNPGANDGYIAPMQSFFLKTANGYASNGGSIVKFDVTKISAVRPSGNSNFRDGTAKQNSLYVKAENDLASSYLFIGYKENASAGFRGGEDVQKLFSPVEYVPEIYALTDDIPTDILFINNKERETTIPLGIKTDRTGEIRLTFTGMDNYSKASKIELFDALENRTINLTGQSSCTYTFNHTQTGISNGRFSLRFENSTTALPEINDPDRLNVYGDSKGIYVVSPASDPVRQMAIYDFQGRKIYESTSDARYYPLPGNLARSPLIVKVITKNSAKTVRIMN